MPTKTEAIKRFLSASTHQDLASLYSYEMECQVNVAQDGGERVEDSFQGRKWHGWTDGLTTWKSFRIPFKAFSDPEYTDSEIRFDLAEHAEGIGLTGWNWVRRKSYWVAFDFDSIVGHKDVGLDYSELEQVRKEATNIPWVTVRKSSSGQGLHLYVFLEPIDTKNHTEHAALARSILGMMSALVGYDFQSKVDTCGGNMWIWHRKMRGSDGLTCIKQGVKLTEIPSNWRDHIKVVSGKRRKNLPQNIQADTFEELAGQRPRTPLDEDHKKLIQYLRDHDALWWWDQDHHMLVTHTFWLKRAHDQLGLRGFFDTISPASDTNEQNCFCFPMRKGAWSVRRYSQGVSEHESWDQDASGWTRTYLNREPDLATAAKAHGGLEDPKGGFVFREADVALKASHFLGVHPNIDSALSSRKTILKQHKDGRLIIEIDHDPNDRADRMPGWLAKGDKWIKIFNTSNLAPAEPEVGNYDDLIRNVITEQNEDFGWLLKVDNKWVMQPLTNIKVALGSLGFSTKEITSILGSSIFKSWKLVNKPFQPEYPGDREWNRNAAQLRFTPKQEPEKFETWLKILNHCGKGLDDAVQHHPWCKANGIITGSDYLKCWIASLFQRPLEPLPYLFLYGEQNTGKSILHESLSLLFRHGYKRADAALISQSGFNAELEGAVLCVVEETDLNRNKIAYNRIKDWVTSRDLMIHEKGKTPYRTINSTHWIHCANEHSACPLFAGDTRIVMSYVPQIDPIDMIPKRRLIPLLENEAPDFLSEILNLEIPESNDRLGIPVVESYEKKIVARLNQSPLEEFISEKCYEAPGQMIKFSDFYDKFIEWADPDNGGSWSKIKLGRELPPKFPKARSKQNAQHYIGNIWWTNVPEEESDAKRYVVQGDFLVAV